MTTDAIPEIVTIQTIERQVYWLRHLLDQAAQTLALYEAAISPIRAEYVPQVRAHAGRIQGQRELVAALISARPALFKSPKTRVVHGIKTGLRKGADRWAWPTESELVELIQSRCTLEQQAAYLVTTTVGRKDAIPADERRRLGIGFTAGVDQPVVDEQASAIGAALLALLSQAPREEEEEDANA